MHRLLQEQARTLYEKLRKHPNIRSKPWLVTHMACADEKENPHTQAQIDQFLHYTADIDTTFSMANSASIGGLPQTHTQWVRPGIMLYGASPFDKGNAKADGLQAVMTLTAPLIAVHDSQRRKYWVWRVGFVQKICVRA